MNVAPTAAIANPPTTSPEGTPIALTGVVTDPSPVDVAAGFAEAWTVTKNGSPFATGTGAGFSFTPDDNGTYTVTLSATDKDGGVSAPASTTIVVFDVAPTAAIANPPATSPEGTPIALTGVVTDPSPVDVAAGFAEAWTVTKNGSPFATGTGAGFSFTPDDNGTYTVTLSATDKDGLGSSTSATITVTNVAPTVQINGDSSGVRGQVRHLGISVTDPAAADTVAGFNSTINWGDGTPAQSVASSRDRRRARVHAGGYVYGVGQGCRQGRWRDHGELVDRNPRRGARARPQRSHLDGPGGGRHDRPGHDSVCQRLNPGERPSGPQRRRRWARSSQRDGSSPSARPGTIRSRFPARST